MPTAHAWERIHHRVSVPAPGVTVKDWHHHMRRLPKSHYERRVNRNYDFMHPVRMNIGEKHIRKWMGGGSVQVQMKHLVGHRTNERGVEEDIMHHGQLVHLPRDMLERLRDVLKGVQQSASISMPKHVLHYNVKHGGGFFDSFKDFVSTAWDGIKTVGSFVLENGDKILDLLPTNQYTLAARTALSAAKKIVSTVDGIRKQVLAAQEAKEAAQTKIHTEQAEALEKEIALREKNASKEKLEEARRSAKERLAKLKAHAKQVGAEEAKKKKELAAANAKEVKLAKKAEQAVKKAKAKAGK